MAIVIEILVQKLGLYRLEVYIKKALIKTKGQNLEKTISKHKII